MNVYLDTSVILRYLFRLPNPIETSAKWDRAFSSRLIQAESPFPTIIRTLDALHLATAIKLSKLHTIDFVCTHDKQLSTEAKALSFSVQG